MLLTRAPLTPKGAFDLHVLGLPPAFVLSQDQTLKLISKADPSRITFTLGRKISKDIDRCSRYLINLLKMVGCGRKPFRQQLLA